MFETEYAMAELHSSTTEHEPDPRFRAHGRVDYDVDGQLLIATATGPFNNELIAALPAAIGSMVAELKKHGRWGQVLTFKVNALASPSVIADLGTYLRARYTDPATNPVTAIVMADEVFGKAIMADAFLNCYLGAGVKSQVFDNDVDARSWVLQQIGR